MDTRIKLMIDANYDYKRYLRANSYWYKTLNRNPDMIDVFINEVKEKYKLRRVDKINNLIDKIDMVSKFINVLRWYFDRLCIWDNRWNRK